MGPRKDDTTFNEARAGAQAYLDARLTKPKDAPSRKPFRIPVIDLAPSFSTDRDARKSVAAKIRDACEGSGFFYITSHGVPLATIDSIIRLAERFFKELTPEQKKAMHMSTNNLHRGYEDSAYTSINGDVETKEGFNWGYEEMLDPTGGDGLYCDLDGSKGGSNVWPSEKDLPGFVDVIKDYYGRTLQLARHLFRLFALALDLPGDYFDSMTTHPGGISRLLYYPPSKTPKPLSAENTEEEIGLGAHSDYECFTLLLSSSSPGLEILSPDGYWTEAPPLEGSYIVNIADFMMRWTNDRFKSTVHRVVNRTKDERYSVPFFFSINYDQTVETLPSCISDERPSKYPPIKAGEYILERLNSSLQY
ncbi:hypothetical protein BDY21DRAFT_349397 [Lineolata rhizophorae]|uniref:Fe2OG dioxygenase domain-containing protein n=1 Tax=Lineolata rhizophorae TaxID=578093 RepID=A0A6A6NW02_9PEZI|nr:hypothetical protein BDY21DRAFT_349397 [Lineolata rhizophorae]